MVDQEESPSARAEHLGLPGTGADFVITHAEAWPEARKKSDPILYADWMARSVPGILAIDASLNPAPRRILGEALNSFSAEQKLSFAEALAESLLPQEATSENK